MRNKHHIGYVMSTPLSKNIVNSERGREGREGNERVKLTVSQSVGQSESGSSDRFRSASRRTSVMESTLNG